MLRKIRIGMSVVLFALITFYFLDFADILPNSFHRLAHIQFVPAVLSLSIGILIVLIALTLLFGRIYCSTICPMGILQDVIARISKSTGKKKKRYKYSPAKNILRWTVLGVTVIASVCGFVAVLGLLDPYSAYGRIIVHIFKPVYMLGNNLLESIFSRFDNYTFYQVDTSIVSLSSLLIAIMTFAVIMILAWKHGRTWCNTICPVGTVLGLLSRYSLFKVRIDTAKCNGCGLCATKCKAACIHNKEHTIDYSRCVDCFDCLEACKQKAFKETTVIICCRKSNFDNSRAIFSYSRLFQTPFPACRISHCRSSSQASFESTGIHCDYGRQNSIQKRKSDYASGICQPETFSATLYILPSLCQQMPVACIEARFHGIRTRRHNATDCQFRKRIL